MFSLAEQIELPGVRVRCNLCVLVFIEKSKSMSLTDTWPLANHTDVFNRHEASGQSHRQAMPARVLCPMNSQAHAGNASTRPFSSSIKIQLSEFLTRPVTNKEGRNLPFCSPGLTQNTASVT